MRRKTVAREEFRRRAVVGGRALEADGRPFVDAASLSLCAVDASAPAPVPVPASPCAPAPWAPCFPCHMRPDGHFFFLDVPAGRYALNRTDRDGNVIQSQDVSIPPVGPGARLPVATLEFGIVRPARPTSEPVTPPPPRN